jgi:hypothetical protein
MLTEDTPERRERDRETVEAWYRAQGRDRGVEVEGEGEAAGETPEAQSRVIFSKGDRNTPVTRDVRWH